MIKEVIVVEGKQDIAAIRRAGVEADCIITGGFALNKRTMDDIDKAYQRRGIIILTDPDSAGERIRRYLTKRFPQALHAFIPREEACANNDIGVEQASPRSIQAALGRVRYSCTEQRTEFQAADLLLNGLSGGTDAANYRAALGAVLGVGYANARTFLKRLNNYGVTRQEFTAAVQQLDRRGENK